MSSESDLAITTTVHTQTKGTVVGFNNNNNYYYYITTSILLWSTLKVCIYYL